MTTGPVAVVSAGDSRGGVRGAGGTTLAVLAVEVVSVTGAGVGAICPKTVERPFRRETSSSAVTL